MSAPLHGQDILQTEYKQFQDRRCQLQTEIRELETRWRNFTEDDSEGMAIYQASRTYSFKRLQILKESLGEAIDEFSRSEISQQIQNEQQFFASLKQTYEADRQAVRNQQQSKHAELTEVMTREQTWALQSQVHLQFYLQRNPSQRNMLLARYQVAHPEEDLQEVFSSPKSPNSSKSSARIRLREKESTKEGQSLIVVKPALWRLILLNDGQSQGFDLPQKFKKRQQWLHQQFRRWRIHIHASTVLERLDQITNEYTVQQRQQLEKLVDVPEKWSLVHVGDYRLFLEIDEEKRIIRFFIRHRREAYKHFFGK